MNKPKLDLYEIRVAVGTRRRHWVLSHQLAVVAVSEAGETKASFVSRWAAWCSLKATVAHPISLEIFDRENSHQSERTYPRSADPRRSKG